MQIEVEVHSQPQDNGGPCTFFCRKYGLDIKRHPPDWFNALLHITPKDNMEDMLEVDVMGDKTTKFCVSNWTSYTGRYKDLSTAGIIRIFGICILDRLNPSPQITAKMKP
eukprot:5242665-Ditylum_brightwellii.AAC.1